jgi:alcohol dehydrogenase YqhD (iron-dependent ADH family)
MAHDNTVGFGRQQDWASHMLEHELSARYDVSHGAGLAVIFPAWMRYVYKNDIQRFVQFAMRVFDVEYRPDDLEWTAMEGIDRLQAFFIKIGMPATMRDLGITQEEDISGMAKSCSAHNKGTLGGFAVLKETDFHSIYKQAF